MQVKMHEAKTRLSSLVARAIEGEEVIIARGDTPLVRLVPIAGRPRPRFGAMKGQLGDMALEDFRWSEDELREAGLSAFVDPAA